MSAAIVTGPGTASRTPPPRAAVPAEWDRYRETWDGVDVMPPSPNDEHEDLCGQFFIALYLFVQQDGAGVARRGGNVSDRDRDWRQNFRIPDAFVYLNGNPALNRGTHWVGGPDFLVEVISPGEDPYAKLPFYAAVGTGEVLVVHREPWKLELFTAANGAFGPAIAGTVAGGEILTSKLGFTLRLLPGEPRPRIELTHPAAGKTWTI